MKVIYVIYQQLPGHKEQAIIAYTSEANAQQQLNKWQADTQYNERYWIEMMPLLTVE